MASGVMCKAICGLSEWSERAVNKDDNLIFGTIYVLRNFRLQYNNIIY